MDDAYSAGCGSGTRDLHFVLSSARDRALGFLPCSQPGEQLKPNVRICGVCLQLFSWISSSPTQQWGFHWTDWTTRTLPLPRLRVGVQEQPASEHSQRRRGHHICVAHFRDQESLTTLVAHQCLSATRADNSYATPDTLLRTLSHHFMMCFEILLLVPLFFRRLTPLCVSFICVFLYDNRGAG